MSNAVKIYKHFETPKKPGVYYRLVCLTGENKGKAYFLLGKRIVLGRSEKCDVTILDIKSSREHAEIIMVGKDYILTDLGSQNGIVINDLKIKQHALSNGDKVIVGKTVYKFSKITVKDTVAAQEKKQQDLDLSFEDEFPENEDKDKKMSLGLGAIIFLAVVLLLFDNGDDSEAIKKKTSFNASRVKEIDDSFAKAIKARNLESKQNKEKLAIYFKRGMREFREGNYFRAISEFENAQQWSPNDPLANFYLRKTREKLDEQIESYFSKATRDNDAVNYMKASTSYCAVFRLLYKHQDDKRFKTAKEGIKGLEKSMGMDEGEIICVENEKGN